MTPLGYFAAAVLNHLVVIFTTIFLYECVKFIWLRCRLLTSSIGQLYRTVKLHVLFSAQAPLLNAPPVSPQVDPHAPNGAATEPPLAVAAADHLASATALAVEDYMPAALQPLAALVTGPELEYIAADESNKDVTQSLRSLRTPTSRHSPRRSARCPQARRRETLSLPRLRASPHMDIPPPVKPMNLKSRRAYGPNTTDSPTITPCRTQHRFIFQYIKRSCESTTHPQLLLGLATSI